MRGLYDSLAITAYVRGLRLMAKLGLFEIKELVLLSCDW